MVTENKGKTLKMCMKKKRKKNHSHYITRYLDTSTSNSEFGFVRGQRPFHVIDLIHPQTKPDSTIATDSYSFSINNYFLEWTTKNCLIQPLGLGHLIKNNARSRRFSNWQLPIVGNSVCKRSSCWKNWFLLLSSSYSLILIIEWQSFLFDCD